MVFRLLVQSSSKVFLVIDIFESFLDETPGLFIVLMDSAFVQMLRYILQRDCPPRPKSMWRRE